jgi:subtilisin family serine protease
VLEELIFLVAPVRRYTQDTPVLPDVWFEYGRNPAARVDLLLTPMRRITPGDLFRALRDRRQADRETPHWQELHSGEGRDRAFTAYSQSNVAAWLSFDELIRVVVPMAAWPQAARTELATWMTVDGSPPVGRIEALAEAFDQLDRGGGRRVQGLELIRVLRVVGTIESARRSQQAEPDRTDRPAPSPSELAEAVAGLLAGAPPLDPGHRDLVFSISRNRPATSAVSRSVASVKADAARRLFEVSCADLTWAVVDSGVDAGHPAFRRRDPQGRAPKTPFGTRKAPADNTRVTSTYDFTRIRNLLNPEDHPSARPDQPRGPDVLSADDLQKHLRRGRQIDWDLFAPFLRVEHAPGAYTVPEHEHGTHVAGILAGDWRAAEAKETIDEDLLGVCPDLKLVDLRVLDDKGEGDEFSIISALQFVRHLNANKDHVVVHGVNLSLSIPHDVANYACGRTPICEECDRLVAAGVVVVVAAGNEGYANYLTRTGSYADTYRNISITDPGNAEGVITVGATHRYRPYTYGVSYFSSRGPTGDGRVKPDLVAPGEKIWSTVPDAGVRVLDGTSMAAPHVSGSAALLLARHRELVGDPGRVKRVLCDSATDLGRERYFQGSGMVDVLRAIQSI